MNADVIGIHKISTQTNSLILLAAAAHGLLLTNTDSVADVVPDALTGLPCPRSRTMLINGAFYEPQWLADLVLGTRCACDALGEPLSADVLQRLAATSSDDAFYSEQFKALREGFRECADNKTLQIRYFENDVTTCVKLALMHGVRKNEAWTSLIPRLVRSFAALAKRQPSRTILVAQRSRERVLAELSARQLDAQCARTLLSLFSSVISGIGQLCDNEKSFLEDLGDWPYR